MIRILSLYTVILLYAKNTIAAYLVPVVSLFAQNKGESVAFVPSDHACARSRPTTLFSKRTMSVASALAYRVLERLPKMSGINPVLGTATLTPIQNHGLENIL